MKVSYQNSISDLVQIKSSDNVKNFYSSKEINSSVEFKQDVSTKSINFFKNTDTLTERNSVQIQELGDSKEKDNLFNANDLLKNVNNEQYQRYVSTLNKDFGGVNNLENKESFKKYL